MSIWTFCMAYQESELLGYWARHYAAFCDRVIVYLDTDTTDNSAELAMAEGAEVRPWDGHGVGVDDKMFADFATSSYHEADGGDWVIWVDADELLYHPRLPQRLDELKAAGVSMPVTDYYVMVSDALPTHPGQIYDDHDFRNGIFVSRTDKLAIFDPKQVSVHWDVGKHRGWTTGRAVADDGSDPLKLLHYRWLGEEYLHARDAKNYARQSASNRNHGYGVHVYPGFIGPYRAEWSGPSPSSAVDVVPEPEWGIARSRASVTNISNI